MAGAERITALAVVESVHLRNNVKKALMGVQL